MRYLFAFVLALLLAGPALAQEDDPFGRAFFPPELVMRFAGELSLSDAQEGQIRTALREAQVETSDVQWDLQKAMRALERIISQPRVDLAAAEAQMGRVLALEERMKRAQLRLMVTIKNTLTPAQQDVLQRHKHDRIP